MMFKRYYWIFLSCTLFSPILHSSVEDFVSSEDIKQQLNELKNVPATNDSQLLTKNLSEALAFTEKLKKQQADFKTLEAKVQNAETNLNQLQKNIRDLTEQLKRSPISEEELTSTEIDVEQNKIQKEFQELQPLLTEVNIALANYRNATEQSRKQIAENNTQREKLIRWRYNSQASKSLIDKYNAELKFLEENNKFQTFLSQNSDILVALEETKRHEISLKQQLLEKQLNHLQQVLNANRLKEYREQAKQAEQLKADNKVENPIIQQELTFNTDLSQYLVEQTHKANSLSQDNLRAKNVLDSLTQTQRNIEEQISALQGTLVLSRIINQQKQALPTDSLIQGLSKDIAKLRVEIFDLSQRRDELYNISQAINKLETDHKLFLDNSEREILTQILKEREKILSDLVKTLNSQLNLANQIETTQQRIITISDTLQNKLQLQSFWVQSNGPIVLSWLENFPKLAISQVTELTKYIGFNPINQNIFSSLSFTLVLLLLYGIIIWKKPAIKQRLTALSSQVNTLKNDSHWFTPEAMLWTIVLSLPSTLMFLMVSTITLFLFFKDPLSGSIWITQAAGYWLFFATVLSLLRPNGLAYRHFDMPQASNQIFQRIIKQSVWIVVLLLVSSIFSQVESIGFTNDVIGQVMTIIALALCLFAVRPLLDRGIREYENTRNEDGTKRSVSLFKLLRLVLFIAPITLIALIVLGYYYTAVYLIEHIIKSYLIALIWVFGRYFVYRSLTISSRRMAYRRLQQKREKLREQAQESEQEKIEKEEKKIRISTVNEQIFRIADLIAWVLLLGFLYTIWSDLISVATYLNTFILWEQVETTSKGTIVESVTLLNILRSVIYVTITYVLVKNIAGILEVTFFSRVKLSKGTPHTITAILTYGIITFGSISAFTSLGISWNKIQWIFTALSVGLGFGVREIFGSFVSGGILLFERPIRVGDKVTVGNFTGVITKIRLRSTTLVDDEHKEVVLPNQAFVTDRFINWTLNNTITRLQITMKINSGADLNLVRRLLLEVANEAPKIMQEPSPNVNLLHFGDGWIEHELIAYVPELNDRTTTRNFLHQRIDEIFKLHQVKIAFNQMDIHIYNNDIHNRNTEKNSTPLLTSLK
ncbi:potassium transporter KefA [Nicoletella semolina]|nr:potassium transporter KefA [Nicoletella semolina]